MTDGSEDIVRVIRIMEYIGPRRMIEGKQFQHGAVPLNGEKCFGDVTIRSASLGSFSETLVAGMKRSEEK